MKCESTASTPFLGTVDLASKPDGLESISDAVAVATSNLGLMPGQAFQARVLQLTELNRSHKTVGKLVICYISIQVNY